MSEHEEEKFMNNLRSKIRSDQSIIVTTSRFSTCKWADKLIVFEKGISPRSGSLREVVEKTEYLKEYLFSPGVSRGNLR